MSWFAVVACWWLLACILAPLVGRFIAFGDEPDTSTSAAGPRGWTAAGPTSPEK